MSRHESRISQLERSHSQTASRSASDQDQDNLAIPSPIHIERPQDLLTIVEDAAALVLNDRQSTEVAKARALTYIASAAARILPLVEVADAQQRRNEELIDLELQEKLDKFLQEIITSSPKYKFQLTKIFNEHDGHDVSSWTESSGDVAIDE